MGLNKKSKKYDVQEILNSVFRDSDRSLGSGSSAGEGSISHTLTEQEIWNAVYDPATNTLNMD